MKKRFKNGTLKQLAADENMTISNVWYRLYKANDLELIQKAIKIHNSLLKDKEKALTMLDSII